MAGLKDNKLYIYQIILFAPQLNKYNYIEYTKSRFNEEFSISEMRDYVIFQRTK